ncbi:S8 family peptidase [Kribbella italica]|uniref:Subtilisin family serine protease n=1 Tax=Kribbella italica TaxID=1540520 RepID=A0A7W9JER0_9ACTN|nr:S8 family serine peptidase [Kribbella italica]MBB5840776.1 subtilisin family serine protease [Kribbella italica]
MERRKRWLTAATGVLAGALAIGVVEGPGAHAQQQPDAGALPSATSRSTQVVTLVTGDRVVVNGKNVTVDPGPGRDKVVFKLQRSRGRLSVLPLDVSSAVTSGKLDRRLFDVSGLLEMGYDDQRSTTIPLIVSTQGRSAAKPLPGATKTKDLPAIGATAVTVDKSTTGQFLRQVTGQTRDAAAIDHVWLDAKRKVLLDKSVPQIGAPKAWQAGFTGKGVKVAILDTGIDPKHPDFKGRIGATKNFTTDPSGDQFGHGTHVASTVAGSGAASGGKYKGVAPDATLLDGKVCDNGGSCSDSAMLAGLQWAAVEQKAKVVNFSIGGPDTPEVDPIEAAINQLTARTGTLFVVAAGNEGPGDGTVSSPGSADAALTVGAVDKSDQLAEFSSRGPRVGDGAIKPDVTGPGVDIVAARAKDADIGDPVGTQYLMLSGTSMATPHVAGTAALLAQQHPAWKANELKPVVMGSAKVIAGQTVYQQGAGRVDAGQAITQLLTATPGSLSFGKALWPHADDKPVAKQVAFRNLGTAAVTLKLQLTATGPDGKPAPATAFKLAAQSVTVPAGGTASVTVTSDTRHQGADGQYAGRLVATGGSTSLGVPLAVEKEIESYDVTVKHLGPDGKGTAVNYTTLLGLDGEQFVAVRTDAQGTAKLRLPKGEYFVDGNLLDAKERIYQLVWPKLVVDRATTVAVDARKAGPVRMTLPRSDARLARAEIGYERPIGGFVQSNSTYAQGLDQMFVGSMGPAVPADQMRSFVASRWGVPGKNGDFRNTPYTYDLLQGRTGSYFTGYQRTVRDHELAELSTLYTADHAGQQVFDERFGALPGLQMSASGWPIPYSVPSRVTHLLEAKGVTWAAQVNTFVEDGEYYTFPLAYSSTDASFRPGASYGERWGAAAATMDVAGGGVYREGNVMDLFLFPNGDGDGHDGMSDEVVASSTKLFRDGKLYDESPIPGQLYLEDVPAGKASYRLEIVQNRPMLQLANRMEGVWTFSSQDTGETKELLPLKAVRFTPRVDERNAVKRQPVSVLDLAVTSAPGAKVTPAKSVVVQVSGDGGKTWQRASVLPAGKGKYKAVFKTPTGQLVSLKSVVVDRDGNTATQTVLNAYRLR